MGLIMQIPDLMICLNLYLNLWLMIYSSLYFDVLVLLVWSGDFGNGGGGRICQFIHPILLSDNVIV